ncbi:MAG TPA: PocR ligand-binding domain-containing protein [Nitrospirota bacterium]
METTLTDLLKDESCQKSLVELNSRFSMSCHAWDILGRPIIPTVWGNTLCKLIKSTEAGLLTCAVTHKEMTKQAKATGKPVIRLCHAGMLKAVVPLYCGTKYMGLAGGCGCTPLGKSIDESYLRELGPKIGIEVEKLIEHAASVNDSDIEKFSEGVFDVMKNCNCGKQD